jgi:hypothetical protein
VDNQIDGVVLDVLLRKHKKIKSDLGISVAVPGSSEEVVNALFEGMQLRSNRGGPEYQLFLPGLDPVRADLHTRWDDARKREERSRSRFAQLSIKVDEVQAELDAVREAIGSGPALRQFFHDVLHLVGTPVADKRNNTVEVSISNETPRAMRHAIGRDTPVVGRFDLPVGDDVVHLSRTHPIVEGLASYVLETALDEVQAEGEQVLARHCGATKTAAVNEKTSLLLVRYRYHLHVRRRSGETDNPLLAEEIRTLAFTGSPAQPSWLDDAAAAQLLDAKPAGNIPASLVKGQLKHLLDGLPQLQPGIEQTAARRAQELGQAHTRVRKSAQMTGAVKVEPVLPADILGCFSLLPANT